MKAQPTPAEVVAVVAKGEAELALFLMNLLLAPGLDLVGPFPAEVQQNGVFTPSVCSISAIARDMARREIASFAPAFAMLPVEPEELEAIQLENTRTIDIDTFVPSEEIDKGYYEHAYYIVPDGTSRPTYSTPKLDTSRPASSRMSTRRH